MISNGSDNALKVWIFDAPDGTARLLRERTYHSAPPSKIQFYGMNRFQPFFGNAAGWEFRF